ncbi:dynein regulatory complex protein 11 [Microcaecilia unicolor]|uniref:Dynein regulatory complex protein 11 n=1 Tax=Microcaecilia unicolor TaxID=1415580 RepID=A0A6P7YPK0_9AMPH|nr:dynein regulatory complex protein 11 [Microcaecilia unicolor]
MSNSAYNKIWVDAQEALDHLLKQEITTKPPRPEKDHFVAFQTLGTFYVKYVQIFRNLESAYDQIVHPQKRQVIRQVLDGVMGRILELKHEMVELEFSEFHYLDDILQDFKLSPEDLEIPIPKYFLKEKIKVLKEREKILAEILSDGEFQKPELKEVLKPVSIDEATRIIQIAERARQGRLRASFMREIYLEELRLKRARHLGEVAIDPDVAAICIQKHWRGYIQRKKTKREREDELIFLGMVPPPHFQKVSAAKQQVQIIDALRCKIQEDHEIEYQQALVQIKDTLKEIEGPDIKGSLQDVIRQWFIECRHATGTFPDFPTNKAGGSTSLFAQKTPEQVVAEIAAKEEERARKNRGKKKGKKLKVKKKDKTKGKGKRKGKDEEEEHGWKMAPSHFLPDIAGGHQTFKDIWQYRDESWNFPQRHDPELVKEEKRKEVEEEIRVQVDELMRQELKNLKLAVDRQKGRKQKKSKKGGKKKKKKNKKKFRRKKKKDLTDGRTIDSLYKELVEEGLLIRPKKVYLSDYIGEYNYLGATLRQMDIEPMPSLSDVQQLIVLYGVLPLGSQTVHEKAPAVKSLLLAGPAGVGKKMLVHALCTETGANLFNLSAANIAEKYPGKKGLRRMLHIVFKVARNLQPSVVWIGDTEKTFYKKVPKTDKQIKPLRLKKRLPSLLKSLKPAERILIIGTSRCPFNAELKPLCRVYKKIILIPKPDYASRLVLWRHIILQNGGSITSSLNLSCLAKVTDGFTQGHIVYAVQTVLNERRIQQLYRKPLTAIEFMGPLATQVPVYREEEEAFKAWYAKTPLGKKRDHVLKGEEQDNQKGKGKGKEKDKGKVKAKRKEKGKRGKKKKT